MKRVRGTKGFTLVELIVVLVVTGILATFTVVSYVGITEKARRNSLAFNTQSILRTIKVKKSTDDSFVATDIDASNLTSQLGMNADNYSEILISYTTDDYAYVVGQKTFSDLIACGTQDNIKVYGADDAECPLGGSPYSVEKVTDTIGLDGTGTCSSDPYLIESIEDLVTFSNTVNGIGVTANNFSGKCVMLMASLDFQQSKSYINADGTDFGDVNGNGTVEGLKKELTTGQGFVSIGNITNYFSGAFLGDEKSIYGLYINRPLVSYSGLFGYIKSGSISVLNLDNINITGGDYTGGLAGYSYNSDIAESYVSGNVTGGNYTGLVNGYYHNRYSTSRLSSVIVKGNVTGIDYVGSISGFAYSFSLSYGTVSGIFKGGSVVSTGVHVGRILGGTDSATWGGGYLIKYSSIALSLVTVNGLIIDDHSPISLNGASYNNDSELNDINLIENALDTYINGDDNNDGYYWDYDINGIVVRKKTSETPITYNLSGSGTDVDPYLIANYSDLRQATQKLNSVFKLTADIDLAGQRFYAIGSYAHMFSGKILGNDKIISNLTINCPSCTYLGFTGYSKKGTLYNINLENINITGNDYVGGLSGHADNSSIFGSNVSGNVSGNKYIGLAAGALYNTSNAKITSIIVEGNVSGVDYVGGIVGNVYGRSGDLGRISGINKGGKIVATGTKVGSVLGQNEVLTCCGYVAIRNSALSKNTVTVNGSTVTSTDFTSYNGATYNNISDLNNINLVENVLDTYINGDDDGDGYYWDYDISGNIVRKNISVNPLIFTLYGSGTTVDPYLINNYADLKQASLKLDSTFKITNDIDLSLERYYMIGSYMNRFRGMIIGDNKTISNLNINCPLCNYAGLIGFNEGTIAGLNLNNSTIVGGSFIGGVAGYNIGTIKGFSQNNINLTGIDYLGGLTGFNTNGNITDSSITGNIIGGNYLGLATGYFENTGNAPKLSSIIVNGNITGGNYIGGLSGYVHAHAGAEGNLMAINSGGSIISTGDKYGRLNGHYDELTCCGFKANIKNLLSISSVTLNGSTVTSADPASKNGLDITSGDLSNSATYTDRGFNFTDEALDYIWYIDGSVAKFREGTL